MKISIISREVKLTEGMDSAIKESLNFLDKFLKKDEKVDVKVSVEKSTHTIEVLFYYNNHLLKITESSDNFYETINLLNDKIKNNISKLHDFKIEQNKIKEIYSYGYNSTKKRDEIVKSKMNKITKRKALSMKPMTEQEAILQMNLLGHTPFIFCNADLDFLICLIYKRKDGDYGIIETILNE